ncbi:GDYXXLXY domain-containing protein [Leucothrix pacifica]|uniref:GDYXXLXY domain-containing protein n=1 Tax=Leucothrix pacifica TaxID=1247513 RepID=A0A317CKS2_9GAMM|nr:GDYXXLXY domain-containing protein [Leucothrix pacifica]PWQ99195.1 hypothetical protein DKW60_07140 [Leucothrix pacifica]
MRKYWIVLLGVLILMLVNYSIYQREQLVTHGRTVLLELEPVDPRSLMQGDYMALRFAVAREARALIQESKARDGYVILALDQQGVGRFSRIDDLSDLKEGEVKMLYRLRGRAIKFATNAFFFQEGKAKLYEAAKYGEFRVDDSGDSVLVAMRDQGFAVIGAE